jgi:predicted amidophosphoribosyltransferase
MKKHIVYCSVCGAEWEDNGEEYCPDCHSILVVEEHEDTEQNLYERELARLDDLNCDDESDLWLDEYPEYDLRRV